MARASATNIFLSAAKAFLWDGFITLPSFPLCQAANAPCRLATDQGIRQGNSRHLEDQLTVILVNLGQAVAGRMNSGDLPAPKMQGLKISDLEGNPEPDYRL